jgi:hypothetical protein
MKIQQLGATCPIVGLFAHRSEVWERLRKNLRRDPDCLRSSRPYAQLADGHRIHHPHDYAPDEDAQAITRDFQFLPICFVKAQAGSAVTTNAIKVRLTGWLRLCDRRGRPSNVEETSEFVRENKLAAPGSRRAE